MLLNCKRMFSNGATTCSKRCTARVYNRGRHQLMCSPLAAGPAGSLGYCDGRCCTSMCSYDSANATFFCCEPRCYPRDRRLCRQRTCQGLPSGTYLKMTESLLSSSTVPFDKRPADEGHVLVQVPPGPPGTAVAGAVPPRAICAWKTTMASAKRAVCPATPRP